MTKLSLMVVAAPLLLAPCIAYPQAKMVAAVGKQVAGQSRKERLSTT